MSGCKCILKSGTRSGQICGKPVKTGNFCGIHKNCKNFIRDDDENPIKKRILLPRKTVKSEKDTSISKKHILLPRKKITKTSETIKDTCGDGEIPLENETCLDDYPIITKSRKCCKKLPPNLASFTTIKKQKITDKQLREKGKICDNNFFAYTAKNESFNRGKIISDDCDISQMPSKKWLKQTEIYTNSLSTFDQECLKLYSHKGNELINKFARNGNKITDEMINIINENFVIFELSIKLSKSKTVDEYIAKVYNSINQTIMNVPLTDIDFMVFRGTTDDLYKFDKHKIFTSRGLLSTSIISNVSLRFAERKYMTKIIVPTGSRCLFMHLSKYAEAEEAEILFPNGSEFFVINTFVPTDYIYENYSFGIYQGDMKISVPTMTLLLVDENWVPVHSDGKIPIKNLKLTLSKELMDIIEDETDMLNGLYGFNITSEDFTNAYLNALRHGKTITLDSSDDRQVIIDELKLIGIMADDD